MINVRIFGHVCCRHPSSALMPAVQRSVFRIADTQGEIKGIPATEKQVTSSISNKNVISPIYPVRDDTLLLSDYSETYFDVFLKRAIFEVSQRTVHPKGKDTKQTLRYSDLKLHIRITDIF